MSWNFREHDQREEIAELKKQLAVQGVTLGEYESQFIRNSEELALLRNSQEEALCKLRKEADRAVELEEHLKKKEADLRNEKLTRENVEATLQALREIVKDKEASANDAQHSIERVSQDANEAREQYMEVLAEKRKLESRVRELQSEIRTHQHALAPASPKGQKRRPRASSLSDSRVASLENELVGLRASASSHQDSLEGMTKKLAKSQSDLVRLENEKAVLEKRILEKDSVLMDALEETNELKQELNFVQSQNGSAKREEELVARLEEEENKVALYEQQLARTTQSRDLSRQIEMLQGRLDNEIAEREAIECREVEAVEQREEALSNLETTKSRVQELSDMLRSKETRIVELVAREHELCDQVQAAKQYPSPSPCQLSEHQIKDMLDAIDRLRTERDQLRTDLEFCEAESKFKTQALERKSNELATNGFRQTHKQQTLISVLSLTTQHLYQQNGLLEELNSSIGDSHRLTMSATEAKLLKLRDHSGQLESQCSSLESALQEAQLQLKAQSSELDLSRAESRSLTSSKDEELVQVRMHLGDLKEAVDTERTKCTELEEKLAGLETKYNAVREELSDALARCERLQAAHISSDSDGRVLEEEIKVMEGRILRRTKQIEELKHDNFRLETNLRLMEERFEETQSELEILETQKAAMLEDCETAREERDDARRSLELAELEIERLLAQSRQMGEIVGSNPSEEAQTNRLEYKGEDELAGLVSVVAQRDCPIRTLSQDPTQTQAIPDKARLQIEEDAAELSFAQEISDHAIEDMRAQMEHERDTLLREAESHIHDIQRLSKELEETKESKDQLAEAIEERNKEHKQSSETIKRLISEIEAFTTAQHDSNNKLRLRDDECKRCAEVIDRLTSDLDRIRAERIELDVILATNKELVREKTMEFERLQIELEAAISSQHEITSQLQHKEKELEAGSMNILRLSSELEAARLKQEGASETLHAREDELTQLTQLVSSLESENANLLHRLSSFGSTVGQERGENASDFLLLNLEQQNAPREQTIEKLKDDFACLSAEKDSRIEDLTSMNNELKERCEEATASLESTKNELQNKKMHYDSILAEHEKDSTSREKEIAALKADVSRLANETAELQQTTQQQIDKYRQQLSTVEEELVAMTDKHASCSSIESDLRRSVQSYEDQLADLRSSLEKLNSENKGMHSEMDNLHGECQRATLKSQDLEKQMAINEEQLADIRCELEHLRLSLAESEKSGKTAEMNLLLISQQHERTISSLRIQLKEHEKDGERVKKLQQSVDQMKEQIDEMDNLLQSKCAEIEENDDKFIELLKEKKKLASKLETLTKKNSGLLSKLAAASEPSPGSSSAQSPQLKSSAVLNASTSKVPELQNSTIQSGPSPPPVASQPRQSALRSGLPSTSAIKLPAEPIKNSEIHAHDEPVRPVDHISAPPVRIGKKRPLPEDIDTAPAPVEARFAESNGPSVPTSSPLVSTSSNRLITQIAPLANETSITPRRKQAFRSGFTPIRGQSSQRPTLSQPSPLRKAGTAHALNPPSAITDVTNSPSKIKRALVAESSGEPPAKRMQKSGWLGKIRGSGSNESTRR